jgi:hypothetical protein
MRPAQKVDETALINMMGGGIASFNEKDKTLSAVKPIPDIVPIKTTTEENNPQKEQPVPGRQEIEVLPPLLLNNKWQFIPDSQINDSKTYASVFLVKEKISKSASVKIGVDTWNNINTLIWHVFGTSVSRTNFINNIVRHHLYSYKKYFDFGSPRKFEDIFLPSKKKTLDKVFTDKFFTERIYFYNNEAVQVKPDWLLCQAVRLFLQGLAKSISVSNYIENIVCNHLDNYTPLYKDIYENVRRI